MLVGRVMVSVYFSHRRSLAYGIADSGVSLGGLLAGPLMRLIVDTFAMKGTFILLAAFYVQCLAFGSLYRPLQKSDHEPGAEDRKSDDSTTDQKRSWKCSCDRMKVYMKSALDLSLFHSASGLLLYTGVFLLPFGVFAFILNSVGRAIAIGVQPRQAVLMTTCMNVASFCGRFIAAAISHRCDYKRLQYGLWVACSAICGICFVFTDSFLTMATVAGLHGMFNGRYRKCDSLLSCLLRNHHHDNDDHHDHHRDIIMTITVMMMMMMMMMMTAAAAASSSTFFRNFLSSRTYSRLHLAFGQSRVYDAGMYMYMYVYVIDIQVVLLI